LQPLNLTQKNAEIAESAFPFVLFDFDDFLQTGMLLRVMVEEPPRK
jgi:hypothetical protein